MCRGEKLYERPLQTPGFFRGPADAVIDGGGGYKPHRIFIVFSDLEEQIRLASAASSKGTLLEKKIKLADSCLALWPLLAFRVPLDDL